MSRRHVTKFRRLRAVGEESVWQRHVQGKGGALLLVLGGLVIAAALYLAPDLWMADRAMDMANTWQNAHWADMDAVERNWKSLPLLPPFKHGDESEIQAFLESQPLVVAVFDRFGQRRLWGRTENSLVPMEPTSKDAQVYMGWLSHAETAQRFDWNPPKEQDPDFGKVASIVLLSDRWIIIKRWRPGDLTVEHFLHLALPPTSHVRVGLVRDGDAERSGNGEDLTLAAWGAEPALQADPARLLNPTINFVAKTNAYGDGWQQACIPFKAESHLMFLSLERQRWYARAVVAGFALMLLLGFWLRHRARQRAMLDADRLASMTHSLKTPLAILKFRCDTLRLGRLNQDQADGELMKLSSEVDQLTLLIENGLRAIRGDQRTGPTQLVDAGWIRETVDELRPGYEMDNRALDLRLGPERGKASPASLRSALLTLVENALLHGSGRVTVDTAHTGGRMSIRVQDEGPGLDATELSVLGKPYQRIRKEGREGFLHEGQGLGLSLLMQVAEREGWGLSFESAPGEGFAAQLDIQRV